MAGFSLLGRLDQRLAAGEQVEGDEGRGLGVGQVVKTMDGFSGRLEEQVPGAEFARGLTVSPECDQAAFYVPGDRAGMRMRPAGWPGGSCTRYASTRSGAACSG